MLEHFVKWFSILVRREINTECGCVQPRGLNRGCALEDMKMRLMFSIHQVVWVLFESGSMWRSNFGVLDMFMCDLQVSRGELVVHDRGSSVFVLQVIIKLVVYVFSDNKIWHRVSYWDDMVCVKAEWAEECLTGCHDIALDNIFISFWNLQS